MNIDPFEEKPESSRADSVESTIQPNAGSDRKEIFRVLVTLQDHGESVEVSRARVAAQFGISHDEMLGIEREGIAGNWPPLD